MVARADINSENPKFSASSQPMSVRARCKPSVRSGRVFQSAGLFAGIGGIELGLRLSGHHTSLLCEIDESAQAVLAEHFPTAVLERDIRHLRELDGNVNLVAAGFPCQDLSQAGLTAGIGGERSGLVHEVFRLVERHRVPWILLENVPFMLRLARGRALEVIVDALERLGYHWAYRVVDALAFGLPQRRLRVYLVASRDGDPREVLFADDVTPMDQGASYPNVACGFYWTEGTRGLGWAVDAVPTLKGGSTVGVPSPPAVVLPDGRIVTPSIEDAEALQGFDRGWTRGAERVVRRNMRWKLVGNAVNVRVAQWIGDRLAQPGEAILRDSRPIKPGEAWPLAAFNVGVGRFSNNLSTWPRADQRTNLQRFLSRPENLLSRRATAGFFERAKQASLRFPPGFLDAVAAHLDRMGASV